MKIVLGDLDFKISFSFKKRRYFYGYIWDFGGQDIYHATHRFFFTRRSLYLLLTETRRQDDNFDYWVPNIHLFAKDSPIIVVKNLFYGFQSQISISRFRSNDDFNIVENIIDLNLATNEGLDYLKETIQHHLSKLPHIGATVPKNWIKVRKKLSLISEENPYIPFNEYLEICQNQGITIDQANTLAEYLHDLGIVLWYKEIPGLASKLLLQPEWVTWAVYLLIDDRKIQDQKGRFNLKDVYKLWNSEEYQNMHLELLDLMQSFRLCFRKKNQSEYLIPGLLPAEPEKEAKWEYKETVSLVYQYSFIPKGIVNQLTALLHKYIKGEEYIWNRGLWLEYQNTEVLIEEDWINRELRVKAKGMNTSGILGIIQNEIEDVHDTYPGIEVSLKVPCNCDHCKQESKPEMFEYRKLLKKLFTGRSHYYCNEGEEKIEINDLLFQVGKAKFPSLNTKFEPPLTYVTQRGFPDIKYFCEHLKKELAKDRIHLVIDRLLDYGRSSGAQIPSLDSIVLIKAQLVSLENKITSLLISEQDQLLELQKIRKSLLDCVNKISESK